MLRFVPLGAEVGLVVGGVVGEVVGAVVGDVVGFCEEQLPFDVLMPVLAPAVAATRAGTQAALSREYEYGMLTVVFDGMLGPAGLVSLSLADQVTLSRMLPLACQ